MDWPLQASQKCVSFNLLPVPSSSMPLETVGQGVNHYWSSPMVGSTGDRGKRWEGQQSTLETIASADQFQLSLSFCPDGGNGSNGFMLLQVPGSRTPCYLSVSLKPALTCFKKKHNPLIHFRISWACAFFLRASTVDIILLEVTKQQSSITPNKGYKTTSETFVFIELG